MSSKTLEEYKSELGPIVQGVFDALTELGEKLVRADKDLSHADYEELWTWLRQWFTDADLRAAVAVGKGELDVRLFPHGTRNSKVMSLPRSEQNRLLSNEKFEVYNNFGGVDERTWAEMTPDQRNRLLGDKGGKIHSISAQRAPTGQRPRVVDYYSASFHDGKLLLNAGRDEGRIVVGTLKATMPEEELARFIRTLED